MSQNCPDKNLEDFRYDAKLFKQAYKAGLKAKEFEKESKRKKFVKIFLFTFSGIFLIIFSLFLINSPLFKKVNYLKLNIAEASFTYSANSNKPSSISDDDFDSEFIDCKSAIYADLSTGHILYEKNIDEKLYIASLSKLMTALVVLQNYDLDEVIEVKEDWYMQEDISWSLELDKGDKVTVETLLKAMLISSYNDASYVLANHMEGGVETFVKEMNEYAKRLGLSKTEFNNPSGLDIDGGNLSSVRDLYRLTTVLYKNDFIMDTITRGYADLSWDIGEDRIYTTNALLGEYGNIAGKTGYTEDAGECYLGITKDGYVTIVLGSTDRFGDSKKLLLEVD